MGGARTPAKVEAKVLILSRRGWSHDFIAKDCGISTRTVSRICSRYLEKPRRGPKPSWNESDLPKALELLKDGASYRDVAETFSIPRTTLRERLPGYGFDIEDTARLATALPRLPEKLRWKLVRN